MIPWTFVLFALAIVLVMALVWMAGKKRRAAFMALAQRLGLTYERTSSERLAKQHRRLSALSQGSGPRASNVLRGTYRGRDVRCFDFSATVRRGKNTERIQRGVTLLYLPSPLPQLRVRPENILDKVLDAVGLDDIDFESDEFSREFWVESDDRKFAYDVIHPRMMAFLLERGPGLWEIRDNVLCHWRNAPLSTEEAEAHLDALVEFADRIPSYVWDSRGAEGIA